MPRGVGFYGNVTAEDPLHDRAEADVKTNGSPAQGAGEPRRMERRYPGGALQSIGRLARKKRLIMRYGQLPKL